MGPIIIISSDAYPTGRAICKKTAEAISCHPVDREILSAVARRYAVAEKKILKALEKTPTLFGLSPRLRQRLLSYIQEVTLEHLLDGNCVCHGLAAHLYVLGISHAIKVRVRSDPKELIRDLSPGSPVSGDKEKKLLKRRQEQARAWSLGAFHVDETDPANYDLIIHLDRTDPKEAVRSIVETAGRRKFQPMTYSIQCLRDKALAARVRARLIARFPDVQVKADGHTVVVETTAMKRERRKRIETIEAVAGGVAGVETVEVHVGADIFRQAAESSR